MVKTNDPTIVLLLLFGGVMLLLYGVRLVTDAMERALGARLRLAMMTLAERPFAAFVTGVITTVLTQSSSATASVLVGLVSTQLVPLAAAAIMLQGAAVGSTLVVQLLAFHITDYALELLGLGAAVAIFTDRSTALRPIGRGIFSFGLVLVGLAMIDASSAPITASPITKAVLETLSSSPVILTLTGTILAIVFVSSTATIGLVLVLAAGGALPLSAALAMTLGANVGTTIAPLLTALNRGSITGRRLAFIYVGTRLLGATVALFVLNPLTALLHSLPLSIAAVISLFHLGFNLLLALLFAPLVNQIAQLATTLLPEPTSTQKSGARYLDSAALSVPAVALGQAMREILRMADLAAQMLQLSIHAFEDAGKDIPKRIAQLDDHLDEIEIAIKRYLTQLDTNSMTQEQARREIVLLYICTDLEAIGDIIDKQLMRLVKRQRRKQIAFSNEEWNDLATYHGETMSLLQQALAGLASFDSMVANDVLLRRTSLTQTKRELHLQHLHRLRSGAASSLDASAIHLEVVNAMSSVISHTCSIARAVTGEF
ncbi:Na/Pi cotransporter family protein [Brasilonema octagenarum UFV-E1]|uniref:Na/Pi cotransporter family protein n=1 Tax=Brasilonema sennae CENA114 TaxID=415709 RepID=A0A856MIS7_9CYAN|nr:Na/Pi cotransporter family protein [Brasilonema sennae]QDL10159.1 Na/Pi cotransporter family protein [Brasilonema sennae CENA114]QDL16512.1 Na/Pi cotransporter family protein [Brasilonema octagenarum UFV-E1]